VGVVLCLSTVHATLRITMTTTSAAQQEQMHNNKQSPTRASYGIQHLCQRQR